MSRSKFSIIAYVIIGLGIIGLASQLFTNPTTLFKSIIMMLAISLIVFALIYFLFFRNRYNTSDMRKYNKAVKQSRLKYQKSHLHSNNNVRSNRKLQSRKRSNRRAPHLRVIEGNKSKRKNRATF